MGNKILTVLILVVFVSLALVLFPSFHTTLNGFSTAGYSYLLTALVKFSPYAILLIIGYVVYKTATKGGN
jgi:hypothetical protein